MSQLQSLRSIFYLYDLKGTGRLEPEELSLALKAAGISIPENFKQAVSRASFNLNLTRPSFHEFCVLVQQIQSGKSLVIKKLEEQLKYFPDPLPVSTIRFLLKSGGLQDEQQEEDFIDRLDLNASQKITHQDLIMKITKMNN